MKKYVLRLATGKTPAVCARFENEQKARIGLAHWWVSFPNDNLIFYNDRIVDKLGRRGHPVDFYSEPGFYQFLELVVTRTELIEVGIEEFTNGPHTFKLCDQEEAEKFGIPRDVAIFTSEPMFGYWVEDDHDVEPRYNMKHPFYRELIRKMSSHPKK